MKIEFGITLDDRIVTGVKKIISRRVLFPLTGLCLLGIVGGVYALDSSDYGDGKKLTGTLMKAIVDAVNANTTKLAPVTVSSTNIGINTPSPTEALDVTGNAKVSGTMAVTGATTFSGNVTAVTGMTMPRNQNFIAKYATGNTVTLTADYLTVYNTNNLGVVLPNVSLTPDISTSGANGLDTGSEASNTWYYIYVIYNGATTAGLFSTSATSPTLPDGYTFYRLVGSVGNSGTNFISFYQIGNVVQVTEATSPTITAGFTSTSYTSVSLVSGVLSPPVLTKPFMYSSFQVEPLNPSTCILEIQPMTTRI